MNSPIFWNEKQRPNAVATEEGETTYGMQPQMAAPQIEQATPQRIRDVTSFRHWQHSGVYAEFIKAPIKTSDESERQCPRFPVKSIRNPKHGQQIAEIVNGILA